LLRGANLLDDGGCDRQRRHTGDEEMGAWARESNMTHHAIHLHRFACFATTGQPTSRFICLRTWL
jgi:hypothetical protein